MGITGCSAARAFKRLNAKISCWDDDKKIRKKINFPIEKFWLSKKKIDNIVKTTNFKYLRQLEEKEGFIENKIMGIQNNNSFFFNKGGEQDFNKDLEKNTIDEVNKKYKELLLELNYLKN